MRRILFDVMEINIAVGPVIFLLSILAEKLRKKYGTQWLKAVWVLLAARLLFPYNFSLPNTRLRLFNTPGFGQEGRMAENNGFLYSDILLYIWLVGAAIYAACHLLVYIHLHKVFRYHLKMVRNADLQRQLAIMQEKYLGKVRFPVYESGLVKGPLLTGLVRPKLIIPSDKRWEDQELELIIAHEICHYKKKDLWLKLMVLCAGCINWFNPAFYLMKKQFYFDMELVCDQYAIGDGSELRRKNYARALLAFAGRERRGSAFTAGFSAADKLLKRRIHYMWEDGKRKRGVSVFLFVLVLVSGIGLSVSCGYKPQELPRNFQCQWRVTSVRTAVSD